MVDVDTQQHQQQHKTLNNTTKTPSHSVILPVLHVLLSFLGYPPLLWFCLLWRVVCNKYYVDEMTLLKQFTMILL